MQGALTFIFYLYGALFTAHVLALSLLLGVPFLVAMCGRRSTHFHGTERRALSAHCLCHHRAGRIGEYADVRRAADKRYALIFCTSASDTSKLA